MKNSFQIKKIEKLKFLRADVNKDSFLSKNEVEDWILKQINMHLEDAIKRNNKIFDYIDTDKNSKGLNRRNFFINLFIKLFKDKIYWEEYYNVYEKLHHLNNKGDEEPSNLNFSKSV